jgi:hypothetical protein
LLADTTTLYFQDRANDWALAALEAAWEAHDRDPDQVLEPRRPRPQVGNEPPLRIQGHDKDEHPGDPQVVIASVCTPGGFVLPHLVYAGNASEVTVAADLVATLPQLSEYEDRLWVSDAGMVSKKLVETLYEENWKRLSAGECDHASEKGVRVDESKEPAALRDAVHEGPRHLPALPGSQQKAETGRSMNELRRLFGGVKAAELAAGRQSNWQRSELRGDHPYVVKRLSTGMPATRWTRWFDAPGTVRKRA